MWGAAAPPAGLGALSAKDLVLRLAELHGEGERDVGPFPRGCGGCSWKDVACDRDGPGTVSYTTVPSQVPVE